MLVCKEQVLAVVWQGEVAEAAAVAQEQMGLTAEALDALAATTVGLKVAAMQEGNVVLANVAEAEPMVTAAAVASAVATLAMADARAVATAA